MKKLMIAVSAAALCGAVFAVESANIVGYAGSDLRDAGSTLTSALFQNVGSADGSIRLGDVVPVAAEGVDLVGNLEIQYLNYFGGTDWDNDYIWDGEVWLKDGDSDASDVIIPVGQGLWVGNSAGAPVNFRSSGEVNQKDIQFPLREVGSTAAANAFPTATTFGKIVPVAAEDVDLVGNLEIQYLNYFGGTDWDNDYIWDGEVWLKDGDSDASEIVVAAGQGLWVGNSAGAPVTLHIAAPEL